MSETTQNLFVLKLAEAPRPVFKEQRGGRIVYYGDKNDYPLYLQTLAESAPKHGAIIQGKVTYIAGNGWAPRDGATDPKAALFIAKANRYNETLADLTAKASLDIETHGGVFLQIIWRRVGGQIAEIYHLPYHAVRSNADNTQFHFKANWGNSREVAKVFPAFNPANPIGSQILYLKEYRPGQGTYALPGYMPALNYINSEIEVGRHVLSNAQTGFTPSKFITFLEGAPTPEEKREVSKRLLKGWSGPGGQKFVINFVNNADKKPIVDDMGVSDLSKEDFRAVDELITSNIYAAHGITTPALFGIAQPGKLGSRTEMRDGYEIFKNTYVNAKQRFLESHFNLLARYAGVSVPLVIQPVEPIGFDLSEDIISANMTRDEIREKAGLKPLPGGDGVAVQVAQPAEQDMEADTNPILRSLTRKQLGMIRSYIADVKKGKSTEAEARMMLKSGYGLTDEQLDVFFGGPGLGDELEMSAQLTEDEMIEVFAQFGVAKSTCIPIKSKRVRFVSQEEAALDETMELRFAADITSLEASILDLISKDKRITNEVLAETLGVSLKEIATALQSLQKTGVVKVSDGERTLTKPLKEAQEGVKAKTREYRVMYSYEGPKDSKNRPFCAKMMDLDRYYPRTDIEAISRRLGYSVFDRRGGFYTKPGTNDTTPYCRHRWESHLVLKES